MFSNIFELYGKIAIVLLSLKLLKILWNNYLIYLFGCGVEWCGGPDSWAVITGSTDGIGLSYAQQMAKKGYSLLLISRNPEKLNQTKRDIENKYKNCAQIRTLALDFTKPDIYDTIEKEFQLLDNIHVLINNVGIYYEYPEYFTRIPNSVKFITSLINMNIISTTKMIDLVLPLMEKRGRGIIINLSSYTASFPLPLNTLYSASKAYINFLSRGLQEEYSAKGITIQSVLPFYVSTKMIGNPKTSFLIPTPDEYVESALKTVGFETLTYGYWSHRLLAFIHSSHIFGDELNMKLAFNYLKIKRQRFLKQNK
jgi:17beta-estradiol 17-dehydrogenase / very-long-chain 3-oxoacyl-CoA reductase